MTSHGILRAFSFLVCAAVAGVPSPVLAIEAVHYHERVTTQQSNSTITMSGVLNISAAELTGAGFEANDEVLILLFGVFGAAGANELEFDVEYNGTDITNAAEPRYDFGAAGRDRAGAWMTRLDLGGTVSDVDLDIRSLTDLTAAYLEKAELFVVRLSDFGTENTDWFWNKSTTLQSFSTTYSSTNHASVTFDPAAAEDWVALGYIQVAVDDTANQHEVRLMLDGGLVAGDFSEEGESGTEEKTFLFFDVASLDENSHTYTLESRNDAGTTLDNHRESAILVFRRAIWPDLFVHEPGTVSVATASDVQAATITDSLSAAQNALMLGHGELNIDTISQSTFMWIEDGGSTIIDPVIDSGSGLSNQFSYDATDELHTHVMAYRSLSSGAQDLDLFAHHTGGATENMVNTKFLVWGMNLGGGSSTATRTMRLFEGFLVRLMSGKIYVYQQ